MFTHEARLSIVEDNELARFVYPAVPQPKNDIAVGLVRDRAMPKRVGPVNDVRGLLDVKANDKCRRLDCINDPRIM